MEIRKFKLADVRCNPYRDLAHFPLQREVVESLKASIKATKLWPMSVRINKAGAPEIPYGHHRHAAAIELFGADYEQEFVVEDISDDDMLRRMADENAVTWAGRAGVQHAVMCVRAARDRLKKLMKSKGEEFFTLTDCDPKVVEENGGGVIGRACLKGYFRNGPLAKGDTLQKALEIITEIEKSGIPEDQIFRFPNLHQASTFCKEFVACDYNSEVAEQVVDMLHEDLTLVGGGTVPGGTVGKIPPEDRMTAENIRKRLRLYASPKRRAERRDALFVHLEKLEKSLETAANSMSIIMRELEKDAALGIKGFNMKLFEEFDRSREAMMAASNIKPSRIKPVLAVSNEKRQSK